MNKKSRGSEGVSHRDIWGSVPGRGENTSKGRVRHRAFSRDFQNTEVECKCDGRGMKRNQKKAGEDNRAGS